MFHNKFDILYSSKIVSCLFCSLCIRLLISMTITKDKWRLGMDRHCFSLGDFSKSEFYLGNPFVLNFFFCLIEVQSLVYCI